MSDSKLPERYSVLTSTLSGRKYLDDGSNFVAWVDDMSAEQIAAQAWAHREHWEAYRRQYAEALATYGHTPGWRHHGCDHANNYCEG